MKKGNILVIYTGGTIGMQDSEEGYVPKSGCIKQQLSNITELQDASMPSYSVLEYDPLLDSASITPAMWQQLANDIAQHYEQYDGFVILHGTDTMAYTASALSFVLENLAKPVVITGSQVPMCVIRSDARSNLINAFYIAGNEQIPEVCICFNDYLLRGNRAVKVSAAKYMAFESPNCLPLAKLGIDVDINRDHILPMPTEDLQVRQLAQVNIASIRLFPGFDLNVLEHTLAMPIQALILETYGTGNAPSNDKFIELLSSATKRGVCVVNCTQCMNGTVDMRSYATGKKLQSIGVISAGDMTMEACIAKLYFLLSHFDPKEIPSMFVKNLNGEMVNV